MLHALGNAVVPACAEELGHVIVQIDEFIFRALTEDAT